MIPVIAYITASIIATAIVGSVGFAVLGLDKVEKITKDLPEVFNTTTAKIGSVGLLLGAAALLLFAWRKK